MENEVTYAIEIYEAFELLDKIESTSSRNGKKELLQEGQDNKFFKNLLKRAYNPFEKFNLVKFKEPVKKKNDILIYDKYQEFMKILDDLSSNELSGNNAIFRVEEFFKILDSIETRWYSRVLKKDLRAGITASTINSVFKNLVPVFECMLAKPWEDVKKKPNRVIIDRKLDGYRAVSFVNDPESVEILTRNGKPILGFEDIEKELKMLPSGYVYDAEIIGKNNEFSDMQKLVFNKGIKRKEGTLVIFDMLPIEEFKNGKSSLVLYERKSNLLEISKEFASFNNIRFEIGNLEILNPVSEWEKIKEIYSEWISEGYEGAMIKNADSFYECKRSGNWAKLKPFETDDFEIVGYYEGEGKYKGMLGGLIVDFKGFDVEIGSGFTDDMRKELWKEREELKGKTAEVQYQEITSNEKGTNSLRFPTLKRIRLDK